MSSSSICADQKSFNDAFRTAMKNYAEPECQTKSCKLWAMFGTVIGLIFYLWAFLLAFQIRDPERRTIHIIVAFLTGPIYVFAHYLTIFTYKKK